MAAERNVCGRKSAGQRGRSVRRHVGPRLADTGDSAQLFSGGCDMIGTMAGKWVWEAVGEAGLGSEAGGSMVVFPGKR